MKKLKFLAFLTLASVVIFGGCKKDEYTAVVGLCPLVVSTIPTDQAVNVPLNQVISATFNEVMNPLTIKGSSFTLQQGATVKAGLKSATAATLATSAITYSEKTATLTPDTPLLPFMVYTGTVKTSVKDLMGNALQEDYVWTFTTIPQLTVSASPAIGGTTTGAGTFNQASLATVTATPNAGYSFVNWTDENGIIVSTNATYEHAMAGNSILVANFTLQLVVATSSNPIAGGTATGSGAYNIGTSVTVEATPNSGYAFVNWTENGTIVSTNPIFVFNIFASRTLVANFTLIPDTYTLNVVAVNGSVSKDPDRALYNDGTLVVLTATPDTGYEFTSWSGDASGSVNPLAVTMNANKNITANFSLIPVGFTLNVVAVNGSVSKNPNLSLYNDGTLVVLTATPDTGYEFTSWSGDASGSVNPLAVTMNANKNITANFSLIPVGFTLNVVADNGSVLKNPDVPLYNDGASVVLTATADVGFEFISWSGDATGSVNPLTVTMNANKTITAKFTLISVKYKLNVIALNGSVLKNPDQVSYNDGASVVLTATPDTGYEFTSWSGDVSGSVNPLTVTMDTDKNITANFTLIPVTYTLDVDADNGSVSKNPNRALYNDGTLVVLTATPNTGYKFTSWSGDATGSVNPLAVTMDANKNITANFTLITTGFTLDVVADNGSVLKDPDVPLYNDGASVELTATPDNGYVFDSWGIDATGSDNPLTVIMNSDKNITANFVPAYTLNVEAVNGSVSKDPDLALYNDGALVMLTATADNGYVFDSWSGDGSGSVNPLAVTMDTDKNITANFVPAYTLNVVAVNGSVLKNPDRVSYNDGASVELTATADNGYVFDSWSDDATGSDNPLTIIMDSDKDITANFTVVPPLGPGAVDLGTAADFVAIGKSGIDATGVTSITGDIGVSPAAATAITGFGLIMDATNTFSTSSLVVGKVYASDYTAPTPAKMTQAISDMEKALTAAMGMVNAPIVNLGAGNISGMTLVAGLYKFSTGLLITSQGVTLTGGPDDTWVFQIADDFTVNNSAIITLAGGAQAKNIFWVTSTQALLGSSVDFYGNILAQTLISINTGSNVHGRLLSQTAVTLNAATIVKPD